MKFGYLFPVLLFTCAGQAQSPDTRTLLTIGGRETEAGEFIRMYKKSTEPGKTLNIDEYLQQFILFKLKVADAISEGYDTTRAFRNELNGYRTQLAQSYLTDSQTKERLLKSAYQRSLTDINAWHILIGLSPDAAPEDTLRAWKKAVDIRERIVKGEPFEQVARSSSDDKSALTNGGNLGYFTVFQMITPFEDAAYSLNKGEISQPVRTSYGYHIIKVADKRDSRGRVKVAHIMKAAPPGITDSDAKKAAEAINVLYDQLINGASFSDLARTSSDHKESALRGGEMEWFGTGEIITDFSEAAFSLRDTGTYTRPVRTPYGWHIIKLLAKKKTLTFEESKSFLESRINQSYLNSISKKSFVEKLKKDYNFRVEQDAYNWFVLNTDTLLIQGLRKFDRSSMPPGNLYTFADQRTTTADFANYVEKRGFMIDTKDSVMFISRTLETKASDQLVSYENSLLEKKHPEFRYLMNEFHDGILLFEISGKRVWNRVSEDSAGLQRYYEDNKQKFLSEPGIAAKIYTLRIPDGARALENAYKKYSAKKDPDALLKKKFNRKKDSVLVITEGRWLKGQDSLIDALNWELGAQPVSSDGFPAIVKVTELIDPAPLPLEDVQGEMVSLWQDYLEKSWIGQLKQKYSVRIDNVALGEVKKQLGRK